MTKTMTKREIDALIAQKVFGCSSRYERRQDRSGGWHDDAWCECPGWERGLGHMSGSNYDRYVTGDGIEVPYYSSDIGESWSIVEKLRDLGWFIDISLNCGPYVTDAVSVNVWKEGPMSHSYSSMGEDTPLTICQAVLQI